MKDLSMHIMDIVQNSTRAKAKLIEIYIVESEKKNQLDIVIKDDGMGMDKDMLDNVTDPFTTSRTSRKVGMGLPLFKQSAEQSNGNLSISSQKGVGTIVNVEFELNHFDRPPMGDMAEAISMIITGNPDFDFVYSHITDKDEYVVDSREVKEAIDGVPISSPDVYNLMKEMIGENLKELY
ncbi:MAG: ATP-binding protein [Hyphomicrobiales bacterium]